MGLYPAVYLLIGSRFARLLVKHAHALLKELLSDSLYASYRQVVLLGQIPFMLSASSLITA
jgi:hypothetical protein